MVNGVHDFDALDVDGFVECSRLSHTSRFRDSEQASRPIARRRARARYAPRSPRATRPSRRSSSTRDVPHGGARARGA